MKNNQLSINSSGFKMRHIEPLTKNQNLAFKSWEKGKDLFLHGAAGTGKTLLAFYFGLKEVLSTRLRTLVVIRSVVPTRNIGFLPGDLREKSKEYETPYYELCQVLFGRTDSYEILKQRGYIQFVTTSFLRGVTMDNSIIVIDECQNMNWAELNTIMTRVGKNSRIIFAGDFKQSDLNNRSGSFDIHKIIRVCGRMDCFDFIQMKPEDIIRSGKAKEYLLAVESCGY